MQVRLKRLVPEAVLPVRATPGSFGYDLAAAVTIEIPPGKTVLVDTGWALAEDLPFVTHLSGRDVNQPWAHMTAPDGTIEVGMAMQIQPRSSTPIKFDLIVSNSPGLVDRDYAGPIKVICRNLSDQTVVFLPGHRFAQMTFPLFALPEVVEVEAADETRTRGGFGSTG